MESSSGGRAGVCEREAKVSPSDITLEKRIMHNNNFVVQRKPYILPPHTITQDPSLIRTPWYPTNKKTVQISEFVRTSAVRISESTVQPQLSEPNLSKCFIQQKIQLVVNNNYKLVNLNSIVHYQNHLHVFSLSEQFTYMYLNKFYFNFILA